MRDLLKLLANGNYIILNRDLIKEIGLDETVLLGELCSEQHYWERKMKLGKDGFFYSTVENIEKQIGFKKKKQLILLKKLKSLNLVDVKYHDMPKKRYIKVTVSQLETVLEQFLNRKNKDEITLTETDYDIINRVFSEKDFSKELKNPFIEYILILKQEKNFEVNLPNIRGIGNSLEKFKDCPIEEQKKIIYKSKMKKWKNFYPLKNKKNNNNIYSSKPIIKKKNIKEKTKEEDDGVFRDEDVDLTGYMDEEDDDVIELEKIDLTGEIIDYEE